MRDKMVRMIQSEIQVKRIKFANGLLGRSQGSEFGGWPKLVDSRRNTAGT